MKNATDAPREQEMPAEEWQAATLNAFRHNFPNVTTWHGNATGTWWAMVPLYGGARLVEAINPTELHRAISSAETWPWPRR